MKYILSLLLFFCGFHLQAQFLHKKHWTIEGDLFFGEIQRPDDHVKRTIQTGTTRAYDLKLGYIDSDSSYFASNYNHPLLGIGFSAIDFSGVRMTREPYDLGNFYALYGFIDRTLIQLNRLKFGYNFNIGLTYNTDVYDKVTNSNKIFSSTPLMVYIGLGLDLNYRLSDKWEIGVKAEAKHYSNGRMGIMNKGINILGENAVLRYYFSPAISEYPKAAASHFTKHFYYHIFAGGGVQTYLEDLMLWKDNFRLYSKYFFSSDALYRFSLKYGCGIGLDLFYVPNTTSFREWDEASHEKEEIANLKYHSLSAGIAFNQEIYYNNLALTASMGYYVYRELGLRTDEDPLYQRAGIRYYFPKIHNLFLGSSIKAHKFTKAEYFEFSIGKRL
jgi:hypothetical protein